MNARCDIIDKIHFINYTCYRCIECDRITQIECEVWLLQYKYHYPITDNPFNPITIYSEGEVIINENNP